MGEQLKVSAYGLSSTGKALDVDNLYLNGKFLNVGSETQLSMSKVIHEDFQVFGVVDSEIGIGENRQMGLQNSALVMESLQRTQSDLRDISRIDRDRIWEGITEINKTLRQKRTLEGSSQLGSSFAALFLHGNRGLAVHLGDSRIYVIRNGRMLQITDDHLESSDMFRLGILSQAQSEVHKRTSNLTAYLGMDNLHESHDAAFSKFFIFYPGDTFILCTDGVSDVIMNDEMERMVRLLKDAPVDQLSSMLMKTAAERCDDDKTLVVLRIDDAPGEAPRRGTSTIPRKESYGSKPAAPAAAAITPDEPEADEPEVVKEAKPSLLERLTGRRNQEDEPEDPDHLSEESFREERAEKPARQTLLDPNEDDDDEDGPSLLDSLLANPKRLAIVVACALAAIVLLILLIALISRGSRKNPSDSSTSSQSSSSTVVPSSSSLPESSSSSSTIIIDPSSQSSSGSSESSSQPEGSSSSQASESSSESSTAGPTEEGTYIVQSGDTLYGIVYEIYGDANFSLIEAFAAYNNMTMESTIIPGDVLRTPPLSELQ